MEIYLQKNRLPIIVTKRLVLRDIREDDITDEYIGWLNDPEINKYLEIRFLEQTINRVEAYIKSKQIDTVTTKHFGIYDSAGKRLVGTVTLPFINWNHLFAEISFVIGNRSVQGKGYSVEAVHAICNYVFNICGLKKLWGGYYEGNDIAGKVFKRNGFQIEGRIKKKLIDFNQKRVDHIIVGLLAEDFELNEELIGAMSPILEIPE